MRCRSLLTGSIIRQPGAVFFVEVVHLPALALNRALFTRLVISEGCDGHCSNLDPYDPFKHESIEEIDVEQIGTEPDGEQSNLSV